MTTRFKATKKRKSKPEDPCIPCKVELDVHFIKWTQHVLAVLSYKIRKKASMVARTDSQRQ